MIEFHIFILKEMSNAMPGTFSQFSCKILVPRRIIFKLKKKLGGDLGREVDRAAFH
jgi:hypothetical protein